MITGFNTDIEHDGTVYHVQTEDKGLESPLILSLVYVGGAILASKRSPYDDLISKGFDERELADRLQRQHKLICAAIRAGRIDDLKRMNQRESNASSAAAAAPVASAPQTAAQPPAKETVPVETASAKTSKESAEQEQTTEPPSEVKVKKTPASSKGVRQTMRSILQDVVADFARAEAASGAALHLTLIDEKEFRGGGTVTLQIRVGQGSDGREVIAGADVTVKVLGSTFRPLIFPTKTGVDGIATVRAVLPHFQTGRAALLVRAIANGYEAELRRIIHQG